jgi:hypothetical protein
VITWYAPFRSTTSWGLRSYIGKDLDAIADQLIERYPAAS